MSKLRLISWLLGMVVSGFSFELRATEHSASAKSADSSSKNLASAANVSVKTTHSFEDYLVQGQFHFADQTVITVEEDKALEGLVQIPKSFNERMKDYE